MSRSKNPDLIFDEILLERTEKVSKLPLESEELLLENLVLDRVTLFATHKCNLACGYCNGPHLNKTMDSTKRKEMLSADFPLKIYEKCLDDWVKHGLKHIHFTGGEATLNPSLPKFVRLAKEHSIACSLTTNGTAPEEFYRRLVDNGLSEIRISIDSTVDDVFDELVGVKGTCRRVKDNIHSLVEMRDSEKKDIFVILNACIGSFNADKIKSTMESLMGLNPNDVKLLVVAEDGSYVHSKASRKATDELLAALKGSGKDYELLEKKIRALFRKSSFGLADEAARHEFTRCFVPLTERTLDARGIYPCSIYLRYKQPPLISLDTTFEEQQAVIDEFVRKYDCKNDDVCRINCTSCCRRFNIEVSNKIRDVKKQKEAEESTIHIAKIEQPEIERALATYEAIKKVEPFDNPFMIIKPQGYPLRVDIIDYLKDQKIRIEKEVPITNWDGFSLFLYFKERYLANPEIRIARNKGFAAFENNNAHYLLLEQGIPERKLMRIKAELRQWFGEDTRFLIYNGEKLRLRSNCVHAPDYKNIPEESKVARYFLKI